ncbi:MAG: hypothetical protein EZS28_050173, partial [Streblomastix strix]
MFECGCVTDKMMAVSYKCIVFVLIWNPSIPKVILNKHDSQSQNSNSQQLPQKTPAFIHCVATLCFPSSVKSLSSSTICTRSFLVVGCESPPSVFLFRLDTIQISQKTEQSRNKLWDNGEKLLNNLKYQIIYPAIQRPDP